jgi:hydrogenase small subunit
VAMLNKGKHMKSTRRQFLKLCAAAAAGASLSQQLIPEVLAALEKAAAGKPSVLWIQGAGDDGCLVSALNSVHPSIAEVLLKIINLEYNPTVMASAGSSATEHLYKTAEVNKGNFILVVEGAIPTRDGGVYCTIGERAGKHITMLDAVRDLGNKAKTVIALGTCAAGGGIPAARPNPTGAKNVRDVLGKDATVINVPGCPAHPDWLIGTLVHLINYGMPQLDSQARPIMFFGDTIHQNCPRYSYYMDEKFAVNFGDKGCLLMLGCKGPMTNSDCPLRGWNNRVEWCVGAGAPCIGCCGLDFPDGSSPFYAILPENHQPGRQTRTA